MIHDKLFVEKGNEPLASAQKVVRVTIQITSLLSSYAGCASEFALAAVTVGSALDQLEQSQPSLYRSICDETGTVRRHVNVFVNSANIRDLEALDTQLRPGDIIIVLPAVSGGSLCRKE